MTNVLQTSTGKQIVGGLLGMGAAGLLYMAVGQVSDMNLKGLLVSTDTVSETAGSVSVNDAETNDATLRRLASRAQTVAAQLEQSQQVVSSSAPTTAMNERAEERGQNRAVASSIASALATAPTYDVNPNVVLSEKERLAIRSARFAAAPSSAPTQVAPEPAPVMQMAEPVLPPMNDAMNDVSMYQTMNLSTPHPLPSSGPGLFMIMGSSALAAMGVIRRKKASV